MDCTKDRLVNVDRWIAENEKAFLPPVCNKLMFFSQLNIMFVGGPNTRKDYHIEEGEELFLQLKGDMVLKVIENGKHKDVHIRQGESVTVSEGFLALGVMAWSRRSRHSESFEGTPCLGTVRINGAYNTWDLPDIRALQMFLLPARVPHSPQREAKTMGLVVERRRLRSETDCLRYYVDNTTDILFERWFYCEDLGTQLVPVIQESEQYKTGKPNPGEPFRQAPFQLNTMNVMTPFSFRGWVDRHRSELDQGRVLDMFGAQFETEAVLYGPGETAASKRNTEIWIWQQEGTSQVRMEGQLFSLSPGDSLLIPGQSEYQWERSHGCAALLIVQDPERKSAYG